MTAFPKVALIGPGAIGTTIAAALFERGRAPMVCGRTAHLCSPDTVVCVLQNGVEQRQQFAPLTGGATVLPSVVWFPAQREPAARWTWRLILPPLPGANCCRTRLPV